MKFTNNINICFQVIILLVFLCVTTDTQAVGTSSAEFLKIDIGARASGMAGSFVAVSDGVESAFWNPSGLANLLAGQFSMMHFNWLENTSYEYGGIAIQLGKHRGVCASVQSLSVGKWDNTGLGKSVSANNSAFNLSYGQRLFNLIDLGMTAKFIRCKLVDFVGATYAFDIGAMYTQQKKITLGIALRNLGPGIEFINSSYADPLPIVFSAGVSYNKDDKILATVQTDRYYDDNMFKVSLGGEYKLLDYLTVRAGTKFPNNKNVTYRLNLGLGFDRRDTYRIDYAYTPTELNNIHRFSVTFNLGEVKEAPPQVSKEPPKYLTNLELAAESIGLAIDKALDLLPLSANQIVQIQNVDQHPGNWLVESLLIEKMTKRGFKIVTPAPSTSETTDDTAQSLITPESQLGARMLLYRIVELGVNYTDSWREHYIGQVMVQRVARTKLFLRLTSPQDDKIFIWADQVDGVATSCVPYKMLKQLEVDEFLLQSTTLEDGKLRRFVEPVVVSAIVAGLVYLFYSTK